MMRKVLVPKSVVIGKQLYNVRALQFGKEHKYGYISYTHRTIVLWKGAHPHSFWHELTHGILHEMGEPKLRDDEKFVDRFSKLLHKAIATAEL